MKNLTRKLMAGGAVLILAAIGTVLNRQAAHAQGQGGPAVTIGSPLPLPVTGTVAVTGNVAATGTVAATQSGPWSVGINGTPTVSVAGTPSVSVASLPAVQLSGTPTVTVTTPAAAPLLVVNLSDKGRTPYQATESCSSPSCSVTFPTVPSGQRLVVESVSIRADYLTPVNTAPNARLYGPATFHEMNFPLTPVLQSNSASSTQSVLAYFDPGSQPGADVLPVPFFGAITLSGYLVDCTVAPCAAIVHYP